MVGELTLFGPGAQRNRASAPSIAFPLDKAVKIGQLKSKPATARRGTSTQTGISDAVHRAGYGTRFPTLLGRSTRRSEDLKLVSRTVSLTKQARLSYSFNAAHLFNERRNSLHLSNSAEAIMEISVHSRDKLCERLVPGQPCFRTIRYLNGESTKTYPSIFASAAYPKVHRLRHCERSLHAATAGPSGRICQNVQRGLASTQRRARHRGSSVLAPADKSRLLSEYIFEHLSY